MLIPWARDSDAGGQWAQAAALVPVLGGASLHAFAEKLGWNVRLGLPPIIRLHPAWGVHSCKSKSCSESEHNHTGVVMMLSSCSEPENNAGVVMMLFFCSESDHYCTGVVMMLFSCSEPEHNAGVVTNPFPQEQWPAAARRMTTSRAGAQRPPVLSEPQSPRPAGSANPRRLGACVDCSPVRTMAPCTQARRHR
jgi:hypothetical protein